MQQRPLGNSGIDAGTLCLGTVKFGKPTPDDECQKILATALDAGIDLIDTARVYGRSEEIIGRALKALGRPRGVRIVTKVPPTQNDRASIVRYCEQSLQALQVETIDVLLLHRPSATVPIGESIGAFAELIKAGKIRAWGTSAFKGWRLTEAVWQAEAAGAPRPACEQAVYSLLCRHMEIEVVPAARAYGVGLMLWSPLGAGVLTGRYSRSNPPKHMDLTEAMWQVVETAGELARAKGCTLSQLALAWCLHQPQVTCTIAGPRTHEQLLDNLGALNVSLIDDDLKRLDAVAPPGWTDRREWIEIGR